MLLAYTPLVNYFDKPVDQVVQGETLRLTQLADSLSEVLNVQTRYIDNHLRILKGEDEMYAEEANKEVPPPQKEVDEASLFYVSPQDSSLRRELQGGQYNLGDGRTKRNEALHFYSPVDGLVNSGFDPAIGHYAVDLIASRDAPVKATLDGTVVFSEFSSTTGHVIVLQHLNNYISIYKHNSVLLKQVGNFVHAGEPIAVIGNSGEMTTGPHLHFELWLNGRPIDPENFIIF